MTTYASEVIQLVPQMKKPLSHDERIYVSSADFGVRMLTIARALTMLAGASAAAYA